ncbi:MAG: 50S ribosomal protein L22 [Candidatus Paceibacterales bacterium]
MAVTARLRYLRIAPRKVRLVADLIREKTVEEAQTILSFTQKKVALPFLKLLRQAIANARNKFQLGEENFYISKVLVDEGPKYKRWMPRARGQASEIQKKTSHITIVLEEIGKKAKKPKKIKKPKEVKKIEKIRKVEGKEKPKLRPKREIVKPKVGRGIRKFFRRKAF